MAQLQVFSWQCRRRQEYFFSLLGQSFSLAGFTICLIKRKGRTFGYKGLAFKSGNPSPSDHLLSPNGVKTWISHNYVEGSAEDVINKMELWNHYKVDNGVAEECRDQFFSQLGQYVFSAEPFRKVQRQIKKEKICGYCFLRRKKFDTAQSEIIDETPYDIPGELAREDSELENVEEKEEPPTLAGTTLAANSTENVKEKKRRILQPFDSSSDEEPEKIPKIDVMDSSEELRRKKFDTAQSEIIDETPYDIPGELEREDSELENVEEKEEPPTLAGTALAENLKEVVEEKKRRILPPVDTSSDEEPGKGPQIVVIDSTEGLRIEEFSCNTVVEETSPSAIEGEHEIAKHFYLKHHKSIKKLLPSQLPGKLRSFQEFLERMFPAEKEETSEPIKNAGRSTSFAVSRLRSFLAVVFPPVTVGSLVIEHFKAAEKGKHFPQFSHVGGSTITCEICLPHQKWAKQNQQSRHKLKTKQASIESILQGNAILSFTGVVQTEEHSRSKCHQDALRFFTDEKQPPKVTKHSRIPVKTSTKNIEHYFKAPLN